MTVGSVAAAAVAGRSGDGARRSRARRAAAASSTRAIEPPPAPIVCDRDRRQRRSAGASMHGGRLQQRLAVDDQADVEAGAAHVGRDHVRARRAARRRAASRRRRRPVRKAGTRPASLGGLARPRPTPPLDCIRSGSWCSPASAQGRRPAPSVRWRPSGPRKALTAVVSMRAYSPIRGQHVGRGGDVELRRLLARRSRRPAARARDAGMHQSKADGDRFDALASTQLARPRGASPSSSSGADDAALCSRRARGPRGQVDRVDDRGLLLKRGASS